MPIQPSPSSPAAPPPPSRNTAGSAASASAAATSTASTSPSPGASVACGEPGSGKSTALAFLRYGLCLPVPKEKRADFDSLIAANLGAGRVYITVATAYGAEHELSRAGDEAEPRVESGGADAPSAKAVLDMVSVRFAGHGELELLATDGLARLDLLTRFAREDVERVRAELAKVRREMDESAPALFRLDRGIAALAKAHTALPAERARLAELKKAAGGDPVDLDQANRMKALRERERMMLEAAEREVAWLHGEAGLFAATALRRLGQVPDREAESGPNAPLVSEVARELARIAGQIESAAARTAQECDAARALIAKNKRALAERHMPEDDAYRALLAAHESDAGRAFARLKLEKAVAELEKAREEHTARVHERGHVARQRDRLRTRSRALVQELLDVLEAAARKVSSALEGLVQVTVNPEAERTAFRALLGELVKGKRFDKADLDTVAASFTPEDLFSQVMRGDASLLTEKLESQLTAMRLITELLDNERVYRLETVDMPHIPVVWLFHGKEPKPSETLSSGQRKLAFFALLLLDRTGTVIVDQPEDDLANRFLATDLCPMFAEAQADMQFIFVSHNGNVPILGRAQRLFEMASDGKRAWIGAAGEPSAVREPMEDNFEGGRSAFLARKEFYGVR